MICLLTSDNCSHAKEFNQALTVDDLFELGLVDLILGLVHFDLLFRLIPQPSSVRLIVPDRSEERCIGLPSLPSSVLFPDSRFVKEREALETVRMRRILGVQFACLLSRALEPGTFSSPEFVPVQSL